MTEETRKIKEALEVIKKAERYLEDVIDSKRIIDTEAKKSLKLSLKIISSESKKIQKELDKIRKECKHEFKWICFGHNDSAYDCIYCGVTEYR